MLTAEGERVGRSFRYFAEKWKLHGESLCGENGQERLIRGGKAAAARRVGIFERLASLAEMSYAKMYR